LNGTKIDWQEGLTVEKILADLDNKFPVLVKVDGKPIMKKYFKTFQIPDGAEVNTIDIIAGG
jgi:sulfur carrier protein ThiS